MGGENTNQTGQTFDGACSSIRIKIKAVGTEVKLLADISKKAPDMNFGKADNGEIIANLMLSYRHLEDAAMRVGKAIQAFEGGASIYDSNDAKRASESTNSERQAMDSGEAKS